MKISFNRTSLLVTALIAVFFVFLSFKSFYPLESLERVVYSIQMRLDLGGSIAENKIAIVNIDDKSLEQLGPWPWPRRLLAEMIHILTNNGAKLIGLDLLLGQREQNQGLNEVLRIYKAISEKQTADNENTSYDWLLQDLEETKKDWITTESWQKQSRNPGTLFCRLQENSGNMTQNW